MSTSAITPVDSPLIERTASDLAAMLSSGEVSAREVMAGYLARIEEVNPSINAIVSPRYEEALREAEEVDRKRSAGEDVGPLAGVPVSIKDCFHVAGLPTTIGLTHLRDNIQQHDSPLVARLKRAGAIVIGKTNVPQLMLLHETDNPLFGRTNHPLDLERSPGGSSGGEAAAVAAHCSAFGLGNDTGGSIRWPSHACGLHGIKPTSRRLTRRGEMGALRGMEALQACPGPFARSVDDLILAMNVLIHTAGKRDTDSGEAVGPMGDPAAVDPATLRVGYWADDGFFTPSPAISRAVREAAQRLSAAGVDVVEYQPPEIDEAMRIYFSLASADGSRDARRLLAGGRLDWRTARLMRIARMPRAIRATLAPLLAARGEQYAARLLRITGAKSAAEYWELTYQKQQYCERFWNAAREAGIDAFLMPPFGVPALKHGSGVDLLPAGSYAFLMNLLDAPSGAAPITTVRADETSAPRSQRDRTERHAKLTDSGSEGLPVGVQVAAWPWREDIVLRLMQLL